jgi:hypothetical protein
MKTAILASYYVDACQFVSMEETRHYLNGACLEPTGAIVATDGHTMFAANAAHDRNTFRSELAGNVIVPFNKDLLKACKAKSKNGFTRYLVLEHGAADVLSFTARVIDGNLEDVLAETPTLVSYTWERASFIDGTFPDWRRVVPDMPSAPVACVPSFNADYVAKFASVASPHSQTPCVRLIPTVDDGSPMLIDLDRPDAIGVFMPMRKDVRAHLLSAKPIWAGGTKSAKEPAKAKAAA